MTSMQPDHAGDGQEVLSAAAWETVSMTASDASTRARAIVRPVRGLESLFMMVFWFGEQSALPKTACTRGYNACVWSIRRFRAMRAWQSP